MDSPLFLVPYVGGSWLIGANAILHVILAHFAIGGGILLVATEQRALRRDDSLALAFVRRLSVFLVLLSTVLGAVTGVAIWFTIGLVQPAATAALIHSFLWGWAIEWVFFIVEIAAALLYVATWDTASRRTHLAIGWVYATAAYGSLVVINGIVTFMLTPGRWLETRGFWDGFFNPTYLPSLVLRTGVALALAAAVALAFVPRGEARGRAALARYLARWGVAAAVLAALGLAWWQAALPEAPRALFVPADALLHSTALIAALGLAGFLAVMLTVWMAPRAAGIGLAVVALLLASATLGGYERVREGARKPFVIAGYMYSNGIRVSEAEALNRAGVLTKVRWAGVDRRPVSIGEQVFRAQCQSCHTLDGYLAIRPLVAGQDAEGLTALLDALRAGRPGMPPILGTDAEVGQLAGYLAALAEARPAGGAAR